MDKHSLAMVLAEFFLDSLREDTGDVENWCLQSKVSVDDTVADIEKHLGLDI